MLVSSQTSSGGQYFCLSGMVWLFWEPQWNGVAILGDNIPPLTITSDISAHFGCGAFFDNGMWFQLPWLGAWEAVHIKGKELLPIVVACSL